EPTRHLTIPDFLRRPARRPCRAGARRRTRGSRAAGRRLRRDHRRLDHGAAAVLRVRRELPPDVSAEGQPPGQPVRLGRGDGPRVRVAHGERRAAVRPRRRHDLFRHERRRLLADGRRQGQAVPRRPDLGRRATEEVGHAVHRGRLAGRRRLRHVPQRPGAGRDVQQDARRAPRHRQRGRATAGRRVSRRLHADDRGHEAGQGEVREGLPRLRRRRLPPGPQRAPRHGLRVPQGARVRRRPRHGHGQPRRQQGGSRGRAPGAVVRRRRGRGGEQPLPVLLLRRPEEPVQHERHHRVLPVQRGPQPLPPGRRRRARRQDRGRHLGQPVQDVSRRATREGHQPRRRVPDGQPVRGGVPDRRAEGGRAAKHGGAAGQEPDAQPAAVRPLRPGRSRGVRPRREETRRHRPSRARRLRGGGGASEARDQDRGEV
ncbi:MAG: hypothetical protein AVDCRST_MAG64-2065, partial [uncultured Phycisphaerae bacterium]